jgi:hypothetical protein
MLATTSIATALHARGDLRPGFIIVNQSASEKGCIELENPQRIVAEHKRALQLNPSNAMMDPVEAFQRCWAIF